MVNNFPNTTPYKIILGLLLVIFPFGQEGLVLMNNLAKMLSALLTK